MQKIMILKEKNDICDALEGMFSTFEKDLIKLKKEGYECSEKAYEAAKTENSKNPFRIT